MTRTALRMVSIEFSQFPSLASELYADNAARGGSSFEVGAPFDGSSMGCERQGSRRAVAADCRFRWGPHG
jgi:hypothetical protein